MRRLASVLIAVWTVLSAQAEPTGRFAFKSYGTAHGLMDLAVHDIAQDSKGFIWVGAEAGAFRYDGTRFRSYGAKDGLPGIWAYRFHLSEKGEFFVVTEKGAAIFKQGRFEALDSKKGLPEKWTYCLRTDKEGEAWVATADGPYRGTPEKGFQPVPGWPGGECSVLLPMRDSSVLMARWGNSMAELYRFHKGSLARVTLPENGLKMRIDDLMNDGQDQVWMRTVQELWVSTPGQYDFKPAPVTLPHSIVFGRVQKDNRGRICVPTREGCYFHENGEWSRVGPQEGFPATTIRSVFEDRDGNQWYASVGVIRLLGKGVWRSYGLKEGLPHEYVYPITRLASGRLLIGTEQGIAEVYENTFRAVPNIPKTPVRNIVPDAKGRIWYAGGGATIYRWDPSIGVVKAFGTEAGLAGVTVVRRLCIDAEGTLWAGTSGAGLLKGNINDENMKMVKETLPGAKGPEEVRDLILDKQGRIWAGAEGGLSVREKGVWKRFSISDGFKEAYMSYLAVGPSGEIAAPYYSPLGAVRFKYENGKVEILEQLDEKTGFPSSKAYQVGFDAKGNLWFGFGNGVCRVKDGKVVWFDTNDGLVGNDTGAQAFWGDKNGDVWIGTSAGLARFDASKASAEEPLPTSVIESMTVGKDINASPANNFKVPPRKSVSFTFSSYAFSREDIIEHEIRLLGLDDAWQPMDVNSQTFPGLGPGKYTFEVRSRVGKGLWGEAASLAFSVLPTWYQTWWFRSFIIILVVGSLFYVQRVRTEKLHQAAAELQTTVDAKTKDLAQANEALKKVVDHIQATSQKLESAATHLSTSTDEMAHQADQLTQGAELQGDATHQIAGAISELTHSIEGVVSNVRRSEDLAESAMNAAEMGSHTVKASHDAMQVIQRVTEGIFQATAVIQDIAMQTGMLSINAAIEAAKARQYGRGFAVVAGEIQKLAERSSKAAAEIELLIAQAGEAVKMGSNTVNATVQALEETRKSMSLVKDKILEIGTASDEQYRTSEAISEKVESVAKNAVENAQSIARSGEAIQQVATTALNMAELSQELTEASQSI